ncbi:hypothetical protein ASPZODRAFT_138197 [Penicilliopsis zonata CBS 506.65]|uniref:Uncharacterized protein n=1 Tax=Penicilliopsis zonata CBS 506.65 TaxID=1073090 RepID=A0A1L9SVD1_9EURO|nr:hypothetical protein ASPZODRAFT_138197 [Penicilliopsis zonata CBS 506.65]OJJ51074.1 hypothetical protein ASPZODRAFT_138197 [Penicilliopsis zonata CBS 506.65]
MNHHIPISPTHVPSSHGGEIFDDFCESVSLPPNSVRPGSRFGEHAPTGATLVDQMGRFNIRDNELPNHRSDTAQVNNRLQGVPPIGIGTQTTYYEGFTFSKAEPEVPGQKASWTRANKIKMRLSQNDLAKMVQKKTRKHSAAKQYQGLSILRRAHVDRLIEERRRESNDPKFEWYCAYVSTDEKAFKGKGARPGDYETVSMDVIVARKLRPGFSIINGSSPHAVLGDLVDLDTPIRTKERTSKFDNRTMETGHQPFNKVPGIGGLFPGPGGHPPQHVGGPSHSGMGRGATHQHLPPQIHHQQAYPGSTQVPTGLQPAMNRPGTSGQGPQSQMASGGIHQLPQRPNNMGPRLGRAPLGPEVNGRPDPRLSAPHAPPQFLPPTHQFDSNQGHGKPNAATNKPAHSPRPPLKSPKLAAQSVDDSFSDCNSDATDDSMCCSTDGSSVTSVYEDDFPDKPAQARGSLHQRTQSPKEGRFEPVYRTHSRKQPSNKHITEGRNYRRLYPAGQVDLILENSRLSRREGRMVRDPEVPHRGLQTRPEIINHDSLYQAYDSIIPSLDPDHPFSDKARERRALDDQIRARILEDRADELRHRERELETRTRTFEDEVRYMNMMNPGRQMPLREPSVRSAYKYSSYHPREIYY